LLKTYKYALDVKLIHGQTKTLMEQIENPKIDLIIYEQVAFIIEMYVIEIFSISNELGKDRCFKTWFGHLLASNMEKFKLAQLLMICTKYKFQMGKNSNISRKK
jgi:hypothetical protein